ncbi:HU family DNA-binding protein [Planktotalea sp.]|uniref:HU family DNA-binding protein n=1 Tax=Planktotalea sp. TaxID=2029877 RepID=UPI003D6A117F
MASTTTTKTTVSKSKAKTTTAKPASRTTKTSSTKSAATASAIKASPIPVVVTEVAPVVSDPALKKKELIDTVTERSGIKKKDAKPVVEAMLAVLGQTLSEGREINLQPLGKVKINRTKEVQGGSVIIAKIRQSNRVPKADADKAPAKAPAKKA